MNIEPYPDDQALAGPDTPKLKQIDDLIRYLVTVRHRFGNTAITFNGRCTWGSNALWARDELQQQLAVVREKIETIVCTGGCDAGVVLLSQDGPTHKETVGGREISVYDHEYFSPLGDALIELYRLAGGVVEEEKPTENPTDTHKTDQA